MELEKLIAYHCGPALSGIKPANIFSCSGKFCLYTAAVHLNKRCNPFGVYFLPVCRSNGATLLFVYNKNLLESVLQDKTVKQILHSAGYTPGSSVQDLVFQLSDRLAYNADFPHEIGVFLGYPVEDVLGFINNHGVNYKICGCWKVYGDEQRAADLFRQYMECRKKCLLRMTRGESLEKLCERAA